MKYSYEERVKHELEKRTTRDSQKEFFRGAVARMNYDKSIKRLVDDKRFACDVMCGTGFCLHRPCERCLIQTRFANAINDFELGIR